MKTLKLLFAATVVSAGALAMPLNAHADANKNGDGGTGTRGEWRTETFPVDESKGPYANAPLTAEQLAFAESAHMIRFGNQGGESTTPIQPKQLLIPRCYDDKAKDLWTVFNIVQLW